MAKKKSCRCACCKSCRGVQSPRRRKNGPRRRKNSAKGRISVTRGLRVNQQSASAKHAKTFHWGVPARQVIRWSDAAVDRALKGDLVEIGRLVELRIRQVGDRRITQVPVPKNLVNQCHLAFDRGHRNQRMYVLMIPSLMRRFARFYDDRNTVDLRDYAVKIGSRHGKRDYPAIRVTPLGRLTHVIYRTKKGAYWPGDKPDGLSEYIHQQGEEGGVTPGIGVDRWGRLWLAGGSYQCLRPGITR